GDGHTARGGTGLRDSSLPEPVMLPDDADSRGGLVIPFPPGRWRGQWIWGHHPAISPWNERAVEASLDPARFDQWVLFRRTFDLDGAPKEAPFRITADSRYILWVNGQRAARGPIRHGP